MCIATATIDDMDRGWVSYDTDTYIGGAKAKSLVRGYEERHPRAYQTTKRALFLTR